MANQKFDKSQLKFLSDIANDFNFRTMDELALNLGYHNAQQMAQERFKCKDIYECFSSQGNAERYLELHLMLRDRTREKSYR